MTMVEASFGGTFRTILVLLVLWLVIRMLLRAQQAKPGPGAARSQRPKGDVRIEDAKSASNSGRIIDADFEEIK